MNDHLPVRSPVPARETGRLDVVGQVPTGPVQRQEASIPPRPHDRTMLGNHGNGRAAATALFVMDLPPAAMLMGNPMALQLAEEIAAVQHDILPSRSGVPAAGPGPGQVIGGGDVHVVATLLPEELIGELGARTLHISEDVLRAGAAVLADGGVAMRTSVITSNLEAATVAAEELPRVPEAFVKVVIFDIGVREAAAIDAEIGHENLVAQSQGATPEELVVELPGEVDAAVPQEPEPPPPVVSSGGVAEIITRLRANRPRPAWTPGGQEQIRLRVGSSAISRMHAFARAYSRGDEQRFNEFQAAAIRAATTGLRLDDPQHGRAAAFLASLAQHHGDKLGSLIRVENGVVRIDSKLVSPAQLQRLLRHNSSAEIIAMESRRLARHLPGGQQAMGAFLAQATSAEGVSLSDSRYGQVAQRLAAILSARPELAEAVKVENGRLRLNLSSEDAQALVEYFDYLTADDLPESVRKIRDANTAAFEASSNALEAFESAQVFLTVYNHLEQAQESSRQAERHRPGHDDGGDTPTPPVDHGGEPDEPPLPPAPEPQLGTVTSDETEQHARANQRHTRAAESALQAALLLNRKNERHLEELRAGVEASADARLAAMQQHQERQRLEYTQALTDLSMQRAIEASR